MCRKPPSAAAPAPTQRVGSTRCVCTSITGALPSNASSAASSSSIGALGHVEEAAAVRGVDRPQRRRRAAPIGRVLVRRHAQPVRGRARSCRVRVGETAFGRRVAEGAARTRRSTSGGAAAERRTPSSADRTGGGYSARSKTAVFVRAAWRPGIAATTLASTSAPIAIERDRERGNRRLGHDVDLRSRTGSTARARGRCRAARRRRRRSRPRSSTATRRRRELPAGEAERLQQREVASAPAHRRDERERERDDRAGGERARRGERRVAHRAVVDDLGRALHGDRRARRSSSAGSASCAIRSSRVTRRERFAPGAEADEDRRSGRSGVLPTTSRSGGGNVLVREERAGAHLEVQAARSAAADRGHRRGPDDLQRDRRFDAPVLTATVSPRCLCSWASVFAPSTIWSARVERVAREQRRTRRARCVLPPNAGTASPSICTSPKYASDQAATSGSWSSAVAAELLRNVADAAAAAAARSPSSTRRARVATRACAGSRRR